MQGRVKMRQVTEIAGENRKTIRLADGFSV
jgi:hypothetical protein